MIGKACLAVVIALGGASAARSEVIERHTDGFTLRFAVAVETAPEDVHRAVGEVGQWWDGAHTHSGSAANMTLFVEPGGCLCEALDGGLFVHGEVVSADQEGGIVLNAPLGPLKAAATQADLSFTWPGENSGRTVTLTFVVVGPGLGAMADPVNNVLQIQFDRLVRYVEYGPGKAPKSSALPG